MCPEKHSKWTPWEGHWKEDLTNEEEISLVSYIKYMSSHSFPLNIKQIRGYAWE